MDKNKRFYLSAAAAVAGLMLILAPLPWPYGYYQLLRIVVAIAASLLAKVAHQLGQIWLVVALVAAVLIFNPLLPLHLQREQWTVLNVAGAALFVWAWLKVGRQSLD